MQSTSLLAPFCLRHLLRYVLFWLISLKKRKLDPRILNAWRERKQYILFAKNQCVFHSIIWCGGKRTLRITLFCRYNCWLTVHSSELLFSILGHLRHNLKPAEEQFFHFPREGWHSHQLLQQRLQQPQQPRPRHPS